jgi:hypothetical protein
LDNFKKFLSIKVIKIVLDSMLYETPAVALATGMVNKTHSFINIVSIEG